MHARFFLILLLLVSGCFALNRTWMKGLDQPGANRLFESSLSSESKEPALKRPLNSYGRSNGDNIKVAGELMEARTGITGLPTFEKYLLRIATKMQMTPERAFERFVLVKRFSGEMENNKGLILWLQYANVYRTTRGELLLGNKKIYELLRQSNSEEELATLFHSLRQVSGMENFADEMQIFMILSSASSRKLANEAWLKSQETPQEVYRILKLRDEGLDSSPLFLQWLRYIKLYKAHAEKDLPPNLQPFADLQALEFLMKEKRSVLKIGTLLHTVKGIEDLNVLATNLQLQLFNHWKQLKITPEKLQDLLDDSFHIITFSKSGPGRSDVQKLESLLQLLRC